MTMNPAGLVTYDNPAFRQHLCNPVPSLSRVRHEPSMVRPRRFTEESRQSAIPAHRETLDRRSRRHGGYSKGNYILDSLQYG